MTTRGAYAEGAPCWADLWTTDVEGSRRLSGRLFGWEALDFRYSTFAPPGSGEELGGIMDSSRWPQGASDRWGIYWQVDDAAASAARVAALGGAVVRGPDRTPYGVLVHCADPAGAQFALRACA